MNGPLGMIWCNIPEDVFEVPKIVWIEVTVSDGITSIHMHMYTHVQHRNNQPRTRKNDRIRPHKSPETALTCPSIGLFLPHHLVMARSTSALAGPLRTFVRAKARIIVDLVVVFRVWWYAARYCIGEGVPSALSRCYYKTDSTARE